MKLTAYQLGCVNILCGLLKHHSLAKDVFKHDFLLNTSKVGIIDKLLHIYQIFDNNEVFELRILDGEPSSILKTPALVRIKQEPVSNNMSKYSIIAKYPSEEFDELLQSIVDSPISDEEFGYDSVSPEEIYHHLLKFIHISRKTD